MRHSRSLWLRLGLMAGVALCMLILDPTAYAGGGAISGQVTSPGGYPLPVGTVVRLFEVGEETVFGQAVPNLDDGTFSLGPVPGGLYLIKAIPPADSGYTQSEPQVITVIHEPVTGVILALTEPQVIGTVTAPDGTTPAGAEVLVHGGEGHVLQRVPAPDGHFFIGGLPVGDYRLRAFPASDDPYWWSNPYSLTIASVTATQTVTLTLTTADLWGVTQDAEHNPVAGATVVAAHPHGEHQSDMSSLSGFWAIGGLSPGTYLVAARPPMSRPDLVPPEPFTVTLPGNNPYTLTFGLAPKIVTGTVRTNTEIPVFHALVIARRLEGHGEAAALTDENGQYQMRLAPGVWALTVRPVSDTNPSNWVYPHPPQLVRFHENAEPEIHRVNFVVLTADATVIGTVTLPTTGTVIPPPFPVTVGLHNPEGVGVETPINPDGTFTLSVPHGGYRVIVHPHDPQYLGPVIEPIRVPMSSTYDLGLLTLVERNALITGTLTAEDGSGIAGIPVVAWRSERADSLHTHSGPGGAYALRVTAGAWHVQPAPGPDHPYLYLGHGQVVTVSANSVVSDVNFSLITANATIVGTLVNAEGQLVNVDGWATAQHVITPTIHNGAPIVHGTFAIHVPGGVYNVLARLPASTGYLSTGARQVQVAPGGTTAITLTVRARDSAIVGTLWDPRHEEIVTRVGGMVGAWSEHHWAVAPINPDNGAYRLEVGAGLWHLNYRIDPTAGYAKLVGPRNIPVQAGQTVVVPLPVIPKDGAITGTVLAPDGSPVPGAVVAAWGLGGDVQDLRLETHSSPDGQFRLPVPHGRYRLGASVNSDWIKPVEQAVEVPPEGVSGGHVLQFRLPDATISGTLTVSNTSVGGPVHVWAWSEDGGFVHGRFPVTLSGNTASGPYLLQVVSGTVWHLGAVFETTSQYWAGRAVVAVDRSHVAQDIEFTGPHPKPAPIVVTFDAAAPQSIALADGTDIFIPAGAMPTEGRVTLRVVPLAGLPSQQHANVYNYGYSFLATDESGQPIEAHFNQEVVIRFSYDEEDLIRLGIHENRLKPAYFSTTTNEWTIPVSYVVDTEANQVIMQIDHFTDFALTFSSGSVLYLPLIGR